MERVITVTELRTKTRDIMEQAKFKGDRIIVETFGKPMAAIISIEEYRKLVELERQQGAERKKRFARLRELAERNAAFNKLSEAEASALVEKARKEVHRSRQEKPGSVTSREP